MDWLIEKITGWDPKKRRRFAVHMLLWSFLLGHVNIAAFTFGFMSEQTMNSITNYLSWMALTITAWDVVASADVRVEQEADK